MIEKRINNYNDNDDDEDNDADYARLSTDVLASPPPPIGPLNISIDFPFVSITWIIS